MSIVVMDDGDAIAASLVQRLTELGYDSTRGRADQLAVLDAAVMFVLGFRDAASLAALAGPLARKMERVPAVLVALSAPSAEDLTLAMALGFTDVMPWPARAETIAAVVERNIHRSRVRRTNDPSLFQQVSDLEQDMGTRYTVDTVTALRRRHPDAGFVWIMGADNLAELHRWKDWTRLLEQVPVAVFDRPSYSFRALKGVAARRFAAARRMRRDAGSLAIAAPPAWIMPWTPASWRGRPWRRRRWPCGPRGVPSDVRSRRRSTSTRWPV